MLGHLACLIEKRPIEPPPRTPPALNASFIPNSPTPAPPSSAWAGLAWPPVSLLRVTVSSRYRHTRSIRKNASQAIGFYPDQTAKRAGREVPIAIAFDDLVQGNNVICVRSDNPVNLGSRTCANRNGTAAAARPLHALR